ncbi:3-alpha-(or 20-beta)-hydroxysteroid dehydrogenase [compost metagenome]
MTSESDAANIVQKAVEKFGRIDVLINNAANFKAGFFEELSMDQINQQLQTSLIGPMIVTRAVLPLMRKQQAGHVITISSTAGLASFEFCSAYSAAKFGLEGWMQALQAEVAPFGIQTTTVNPGFFRTELLTKESTDYADHPIDDYGKRREQQMEFWQSANGKQGGDPAKLAAALVTIAAEPQPPLRFLAGADAIGLAEQVIDKLQKETNAYRELSGSLSFEDSNK